VLLAGHRIRCGEGREVLLDHAAERGEDTVDRAPGRDITTCAGGRRHAILDLSKRPSRVPDPPRRVALAAFHHLPGCVEERICSASECAEHLGRSDLLLDTGRLVQEWSHLLHDPTASIDRRVVVSRRGAASRTRRPSGSSLSTPVAGHERERQAQLDPRHVIISRELATDRRGQAPDPE
jgi:hypothetical protein